jgi:hypothetical protein
MAVYRAMVGGWGQSYGSVNVDFWRRLLPTVFASAFTCWMSVPLEIANKAFNADQKYPKDLRKGYRSPMHAMTSLIRTEGLPYLFRNGLPTYVRNFLQTAIMFAFYDFFIDLLHSFHNDYDIPRLPVKMFAASVAIGISSLASYPYGTVVRDTIEFAPKQIAEDKYRGDYKKVLMRVNMWQKPANNLNGYGRYLFSQGPALMVFLLVAESFGMFKSWRTDHSKFPGINVSSDFLN